MIRVGIGYDIHQLVVGRPLIIGGVTIPFSKGLLAHSDGDVLCHAISEAVLGAAGLPNIGVLFPDTSPSYKDANSLELLKQVSQLIDERGWRVLQLDANIIAQSPKLQPYVSGMKDKLAQCLNVRSEDISVKPRTNEGLGPEGRGEAISAHAVVTICKKEENF